jgi:predicted nuclease of restriction endonuclease-like (RecB) superfamily
MKRENYRSILADLKKKIKLARQRAVIVVNTELLMVYWEIGNTIMQQQKKEGWGKKIIERLAKDLKLEFPEMTGLSERNLMYMQQFAGVWPHFPFTQAPLAKLSWYHHITLLDKIKDHQTRVFYLHKAIENGWSRNVMLRQIEGNLHIRQGQAITNFEATLPKSDSDLAKETLKNPYLFDFLSIAEQIPEQDLEKVLILHIKKFLLELGRGFAYVGNQYNLRIEDDEYFLDLLFFNYHLNCFVVFELKVGQFKPEYAGKLNFYINIIDEQMKTALHKPTIGVLLCKTPNKTVVKFALKGINSPIGIAEYELTNVLPKQLKAEMPTVKELEQELDKEIPNIPKSGNKKNNRMKAVLDKAKRGTP